MEFETILHWTDLDQAIVAFGLGPNPTLVGKWSDKLPLMSKGQKLTFDYSPKGIGFEIVDQILYVARSRQRSENNELPWQQHLYLKTLNSQSEYLLWDWYQK